MRRHSRAAALCLCLAPAVALAQTEEDVDIGKREFMVACAGCHGETGKGTGPLAELISIQTPDLTTIRQRMQAGEGDFPYRNTLMLIDGRNGIRAHGSDMPVWGDRYAPNAPQRWWRNDPEMQEIEVLGRMLALVYYIESIQE